MTVNGKLFPLATVEAFIFLQNQTLALIAERYNHQNAG
jgi:hypothetical protein